MLEQLFRYGNKQKLALCGSGALLGINRLVKAKGTYEFTSSLGSYITLRSATFDGGVVAEGLAPLQYVAADNSDLFPHWTVDDACTTDDTECAETSVQRILNCTPPEFIYTYTENCELGEFYLDIDVT
jgi:hypothetical protein